MPKKADLRTHADELLDGALNDSFPASDPPSHNSFEPSRSTKMSGLDSPTRPQVEHAPTIGANLPVATALNALLADFFKLFIKTKGCHWHVSGPHFRDYHRLFDEQAIQILSTTDLIAERVRKIGATTIDSIAGIVALARVPDVPVCELGAPEMLTTLLNDNREIVSALGMARSIAERARDDATCSMLDEWIDQAEGRAWFLFEASRS